MEIGRRLTFLVYFLVLVCVSIALREDDFEDDPSSTYISALREKEIVDGSPHIVALREEDIEDGSSHIVALREEDIEDGSSHIVALREEDIEDDPTFTSALREKDIEDGSPHIVALREEIENSPTHVVVPRAISIFSKGPDPEDEIYKGIRIDKHLRNVIKGGTVGVEFDVKQGMGRYGPLWDKIRRFFPKYRGGKKPDSVPVDEVEENEIPVNDLDEVEGNDEPAKDRGASEEILDPVGRGIINPRLKPSVKEELEWERV